MRCAPKQATPDLMEEKLFPLILKPSGNPVKNFLF